MRRRLIVCIAWLCLSTSAAAQTIFIVRHAERADTPSSGVMMANDPNLSAAGRARAAAFTGGDATIPSGREECLSLAM